MILVDLTTGDTCST